MCVKKERKKERKKEWEENVRKDKRGKGNKEYTGIDKMKEKKGTKRKKKIKHKEMNDLRTGERRDVGNR